MACREWMYDSTSNIPFQHYFGAMRTFRLILSRNPQIKLHKIVFSLFTASDGAWNVIATRVILDSVSVLIILTLQNELTFYIPTNSLNFQFYLYFYTNRLSPKLWSWPHYIPKYFMGSDSNFMLFTSLALPLSIPVRSPFVLVIFSFRPNTFSEFFYSVHRILHLLFVVKEKRAIIGTHRKFQF